MILPWNLAKEISARSKYSRRWGAQLVVPIQWRPLPTLKVGTRSGSTLT